MTKGRYTEAHIERSISTLEKRVEALKALDVKSLSSFGDPQIEALASLIRASLIQAFGDGTSEFMAFAGAATLRPTSSVAITGVKSERFQSRFKNIISQSISKLDAAITFLNEQRDQEENIQDANSGVDSKKVFIVHGHDKEVKLDVANFLNGIGLQPIILHEQANKGQTIIEKLHRHSDCGFAVVLLTPDDVGGENDASLQPRARQNVILELGYFIGCLGRDKVSALIKGVVETPSDFDGVVYTEMDAGGGWKFQLLHELSAAGYDVKLSKATAIQ